MFTKPISEVAKYLEKRAKDFAKGCQRVYVSVSGGVDSAVVTTILVRAFGPENVVAMYRDIRSNPVHKQDVQDLQKALGFKLLLIDANPLYDMLLNKCRKEFKKIGIEWHEENDKKLKDDWSCAYASLKSRFTTPLAGFIAKAIDDGNGRIFGTGNLEEDVLFRYFDKFGDGAVDNNILVGLTKMEVRQLAVWFSQEHHAKILKRIAEKIPSADLQAKGDEHNDEDELSLWAKNLGFDIRLSYGDINTEGNIAWAVKQDLDFGVVKGERKHFNEKMLALDLGYTPEQIQLIMFARNIEKTTRHKELNIPGVTRKELREKGLVD